MRWIRRLTLTLALSLALAALGFTQASPGEQSGSSAQLYVFSGSVTVAGETGAGGLHHRRQGRRLHLGAGHGAGRAVSPTEDPAGGCLQRPGDHLLVRKRTGGRGWRPLSTEGGIRRARAGEPGPQLQSAVPGDFNPFPTALPTTIGGQPQPTGGVQGNVPVGIVSLPDVGGSSSVAAMGGGLGPGGRGRRRRRGRRHAAHQAQALLEGGYPLPNLPPSTGGRLFRPPPTHPTKRGASMWRPLFACYDRPIQAGR